MENLYEKVHRLCKENNITIAALERECNFGNGTIKKWGNSIPSGDRLTKVADRFHVSIDYLLGRESTNELGNIYFSLAKEAEQNGIDPNDIKLAIDMIKKLRGE